MNYNSTVILLEQLSYSFTLIILSVCVGVYLYAVLDDVINLFKNLDETKALLPKNLVSKFKLFFYTIFFSAMLFKILTSPFLKLYSFIFKKK